MAPPKVIIQHYVPRFYLRNFTFDKKESQVRCFDKTTCNTFEPNVQNILAERFFYDTEEDVHQEVEKALGDIESSVGSAFESLIKSEDISELDDDQRFRVAIYISVQEQRTPDFRKKHVESVRKMTEKVARMFGESKPDAVERFRKQQEELLTDAKMKSLQINLMKSSPEFASIMMRLKWVLIVNPIQLPFWTSDHPVTRYNPLEFGVYGNMGLLCKGIMIHFPLTPRLCLCICDPVQYEGTPDRWTCLEVGHVDFINQWQVQRATRFLVSNKIGFKLAELMIKDHPDLANPDRERVTVS